MATLRKINGRYYAYFYDAGQQPTRKSIPLRVRMKSAAERMLKRLESEYAEGHFDPWSEVAQDHHIAVEEARDRFLASRSDLRPKTIEAYSEVLRNLIRRLPTGILMSSMKASHLRPYVFDSTVAVATRRKRYRHLMTVFRWSAENGLISRNPLADFRPPREEERVPEYISPKQLERLLAAIDADASIRLVGNKVVRDEQWLKDLVLVAVGTGLRMGELISLRWEAVDFESRFITVRNSHGFRTKSGKERRVYLVGDALDVIRRRFDEVGPRVSDFVLVDDKNHPVDPIKASKRFKYYVRLAKLPDHIRFHSLRHTTASWLVMSGVSLVVVQLVLGHSTIAVTQRYAHLEPESMKKAMERAFEPKASSGVESAL